MRDLARAVPQDRNPAGRAGNNVQSADVVQDRSPYAEALSMTGTSRQQAHRLQALADIPQATFDAALRDPAKVPTRAGLMAGAAAREAVQKARDPVPVAAAGKLLCPTDGRNNLRPPPIPGPVAAAPDCPAAALGM